MSKKLVFRKPLRPRLLKAAAALGTGLLLLILATALQNFLARNTIAEIITSTLGAMGVILMVVSPGILFDRQKVVIEDDKITITASKNRVYGPMDLSQGGRCYEAELHWHGKVIRSQVLDVGGKKYPVSNLVCNGRWLFDELKEILDAANARNNLPVTPDRGVEIVDMHAFAGPDTRAQEDARRANVHIPDGKYCLRPWARAKAVFYDIFMSFLFGGFAYFGMNINSILLVVVMLPFALLYSLRTLTYLGGRPYIVLKDGYLTVYGALWWRQDPTVNLRVGGVLMHQKVSVSRNVKIDSWQLLNNGRWIQLPSELSDLYCGEHSLKEVLKTVSAELDLDR